MSKADDLKTKAAHYRELAPLLDPETAQLCRDLARQYEEEAAAGQADQDKAAGPIVQNRIS